MELKTGHYCFVVNDGMYAKGKGFRPSIVIEGQPGHYPNGGGDKEPWYWGHDLDAARLIAADKNAAMGLTLDDVDRIVASSIRRPGNGRKACPRCGGMIVMLADCDENDESAKCVRCDWRETMADLRKLLLDAVSFEKELRRDLDAARATNKRIHRRCQQAESAAARHMTALVKRTKQAVDLKAACQSGRNGGGDDDLLRVIAESLRARADAVDRDHGSKLAVPNVWRAQADALEQKARLQDAALEASR